MSEVLILFLCFHAYMLWRNHITAKTFKKYLNLVSEKGREEIKRGEIRFYLERFERLESIKYHVVMAKFWTDPESFFNKEYLMLEEGGNEKTAVDSKG